MALLAGAIAAMSIASASAAPKHAAADSVKVLHLISHDISVQVIDIGKKGPSPGDQLIETTVDFLHGTRVDRSVINCVAITATARRQDVLCHGAMIFKNGQVQFQGETTFRTPFMMAVTGGTGAYQGVGGQLTLLRTLPAAGAPGVVAQGGGGAGGTGRAQHGDGQVAQADPPGV